MSTIVHLKLGTLRGPLQLSRAPLYLRFVLKGTDWKTLDALNMPEDEPTDDENQRLRDLPEPFPPGTYYPRLGIPVESDLEAIAKATERPNG